MKRILLIAILVLFPILARATTYYVDANPGTDCSGTSYSIANRNCAGSDGQSWDTIQEAADNVPSGAHIVEIRAGTYNEGTLEWDTNSGPGSTARQDSSYIVFRAYSAESVTVTSSSWYTILIQENWIKIEGLNLRNSASGGHTLMLGAPTGIADPDNDGASNNWLYNNDVTSSGGGTTYGMQIQTQSGTCATCDHDNNIFESNTVYGFSGEGIYFNKYTGYSGTYTGNQVLNNTIYNNGEGIQISHEDASATPPINNIVRGNHVYSNSGSWATLGIGGDGTIIEDNIIHDNGCSAGAIYLIETYSDNVIVRNNLIYDNDGTHGSDAGIWIEDGNTGLEIYHNTIERQGSSSVGDGIRFNGGGSATVKNNILANNAGAGFNDGTASITCSNNVDYNNGSTDKTCSNDQTGDPKFVSVGDGSEDYHLQSGSSAIDSGVYIASVPDDIEGTTRTDPPDIGAYEDAVSTTAALTGTLGDGATEAQIVAGGETLIITLTNDTWVATVGADNAITDALIAGIDSGGSEAAGWDAVVKANMVFGDVARTSATVVTITLGAEATYAITQNETITVTIPATAMTESSTTVVATPTFEITATPDPVAALTGTLSDNATEGQIVAGSQTLIITLTNDTWVAAGGVFDGIRQDIIDGMDSAQSEATGWNAEVRDKEVVGAVVRTNNTVVTITLTAQAAYDISQNESITTTVPASALVTSGSPVVATPTFAIIFFDTSTEEVVGMTLQ